MQESIKYNKIEKCFIVNKLIKVDSEYIDKIINKRNIDNLIKLEDNLYYYKSKSLIELLFGISDYKEIKFKNNNTDDYRFDNLEIILNDQIKFNEPLDVTILEYGTPKLITAGSRAGKERNMYWKVKDSQNNEYYIMHINDDTFTNFSIDSLDIILNFEGIRPCWYLNLNGYIAASFKINNEKICIYLHQYIMGVHFEDNTNMKKTVDHINRDKLDNRRENLRFANMTEQNSNRDKQKRQKNACELPDGIQQMDLPKYVCYNKRCYNKENNSWREFFTIENFSKLDKTWSTSKSNNISIKEKLDQAKLKLKHLNNEITDQEYKKITESAYKLFKGLRLSIDKKYNKYKFEYENRSVKPCINYKMILTHNDLQLMIDKFIDLLNDKYKDNKEFTKMGYYKLEKPVLLDFSSVNNEIIDEMESETSHTIHDPLLNDITTVNLCDIASRATDYVIRSLANSDNVHDAIIGHNLTSTTSTVQDKYKIKPDLPPNFSLYTEKDCWHLSFSKSINTIRHNKKSVMKCMCIQTELDRLIDEINKEFTNLNIQKYTVNNPHDFIDKTPLRENNKPPMPKNYSICNINNIDYIQFSKKIDGKKISLKTKINSYDLQSELNNYINCLNKKYDYKLESEIISELNDWKTTNKF
jgi:hypothetical protein